MNLDTNIKDRCEHQTYGYGLQDVRSVHKDGYEDKDGSAHRLQQVGSGRDAWHLMALHHGIGKFLGSLTFGDGDVLVRVYTMSGPCELHNAQLKPQGIHIRHQHIHGADPVVKHI